MSEEKDYTYYSEALHSSYLFYTMEVDKLNKENKRLREALENVKEVARTLYITGSYFKPLALYYKEIINITDTALGE